MNAHETKSDTRNSQPDPQHCTHSRLLRDVDSDGQRAVQCCECGAIIERHSATKGEPRS